MLGREGVTGIDRVCNLGAVTGDRGQARNFGVLHLAPEFKCLQGREKERQRERKDREEGRLNEQDQIGI